MYGQSEERGINLRKMWEESEWYLKLLKNFENKFTLKTEFGQTQVTYINHM